MTVHITEVPAFNRGRVCMYFGIAVPSESPIVASRVHIMEVPLKNIVRLQVIEHTFRFPVM